jgi:predicted DNA-binding transcriptional regulator YafY
MGILQVLLTDDEALALLHATGRAKKLPKNHTRNLLSAERKILAALPEDVRAAYRVTAKGKDEAH